MRISNVFFLVSGFFIGAVSGILYAPDTGKNTRDKLKYQLPKYRNKLSELISDLKKTNENLPANEAKDQSREVIDQATDKAEKLLGDIDDLINKIKNKK